MKMFFDYTSTGDLLQLACTSVGHQRQVQSYLDKERSILLRQFFASSNLVEDFLSLFPKIKFVVAGSFVSRFVTDRTVSRDLDLYVDYGDVDNLVDALLELGYTRLVKEKDDDFTYNSIGILNVFPLVNKHIPGSPTIDVVACIMSPLHTILHFHSTQVSRLTCARTHN